MSLHRKYQEISQGECREEEYQLPKRHWKADKGQLSLQKSEPRTLATRSMIIQYIASAKLQLLEQDISHP